MSLLRFPKGFLKLLFSLVALVVGLAFAAVRTQGGRDFIAGQIESAFSNAFAGSLEIGRLYGDVLGVMYAADVKVHDAGGSVVAVVDSMVLSISLLDALQRDVTIREAEFIRPSVFVVRDESGSWNLINVFEPRSSKPGTGSQWRFRSADVRLRSGRITTRNRGVLPAIVDSGRLFDYTNTDYEDVNGRFTVDWGASDRLIDVVNFSGHIGRPDIELVDFHGQLVASDSTLTLSALGLQTAASLIEFSGRLSNLDGLKGLADGLTSETVIAARLVASNIDSTELAGLVPRLAVPNSSLSAEIGGTRAKVNIERFDLAVGESSASGVGTIRALSDTTEFNVIVEQSSVVPDEIARLIEVSNSEIISRTPRQNITAEATGRFTLGASGDLSRIESSLSFQAESHLGVLDGRARYHGDAGDTTTFAVDLNLFDLDIGEIVPDLGRNSVWNGHLSATGGGTELDDLIARADFALTQSSLRGLTFSELDGSLQARGRNLRLDLDANGPGGDLELASSVTFQSSGLTRLSASASIDRFDLVRILSDAPPQRESRFTASAEVTAAGSSIDNLTGVATVGIDTVIFHSSEDTLGLPPSLHRIEISHETNRQTSLTLRGDVFEGELEGVYTFGTLSKVASLWLAAAERTLEVQLDKELHPESFPLEPASAPVAHVSEYQEAAAYLEDRGYPDGVHFTGGLRINRMLDLNRLIAGLPAYAADVTIRTGARITADDLNLSVWIDADSLRGSATRIDGLRGEIRIAGSYDSILEEMVESSISVDARQVGLGSNVLSDLSVGFNYSGRAGSLTIESSDRPVDSLSVGFEAELTVLPDRNEIVVSDAFLRQDDYRWRLSGDAVFDLYGDGIGVDGLLIENRSAPDSTKPQRLAFDGVVSGEFADTLYVRAERVSLDRISELAEFRDHLGGKLDASISVAQALNRPELVGTMGVERLTYVYRDIGDLEVTSRYSGRGESLFIDMNIVQPRDEGAAVRGNQAHIWGTVAIPGPESEVPFGTLDIAIEADEIDLFFFEILFPTELEDVSGNAAGSGTVTGVLTKPIFTVDARVLEADFLSPPFNLRFGLSGPLTIDSLGFHLQDVALTDPTGGRATLRGDILFNDYRFFSFDLSGDFEDLMIMNVHRSEELPFYGELWVSGSATLTGPLQRTQFRSTDVVTSPRSRLYLPVTEDEYLTDQTFIVFTDSTGAYEVEERRTVLDARPSTEREFVEGMNMNFNITITPGSTVFLVFDPLLGDMIEARGSGRVQFLRFEGEYSAFGTFTVSSGDYLFTAGDVFQRRFTLDPGGTITWDGDAIDAALDIPATYRTRASLAGLPGQNSEDRVPIRVNMYVSGRLTTPQVSLRIALDIDPREGIVIPPGLEAALNREDLAAEYATSVLLTNTFLLSSSSEADPTSSADDLFFNSLSHLVSSQLNRFVSQALDLDLNLGVQQGRTDNAYDLVYGFALRLDEQGIVIRGEGLYETAPSVRSSEGLQGEFVVEYRLTPKVRLELFFRRESDLYRAASALGTSYGAGIVYQTEFANWKSLGRGSETPPPPEQSTEPTDEPERKEEEPTEASR